MILIAKKLTGTENFGPWKRSMHIGLSAKNKLVIVNGEFVSLLLVLFYLPQWERVNTWILNIVSSEISDAMNFINSARDVSNELHRQVF